MTKLNISCDLCNLLWDRGIVGLAKVGPDGTFLDVNPALCSLLGYTHSELVRKDFQQITHPDDLEDNLIMLNHVIDGDIDHYIMLKRYITKDLKVVWIKLRVDPIQDKDGKIYCFLSQVAPAEEVKTELNESVLIKSKPRFNVLNFIKDNWFRILTIIGTLFLSFGTIYHQWKTTQIRLDNLTEAYSDIDKKLNQIANQILEEK